MMNNKFILILFAVIGLSLLTYPVNASTVIDFQEKYQDYSGNWHKYNNINLFFFPMYNQNGTDAVRMDDDLPLSIPGATYNFLSSKISVTLNYTPAQINSRSIQDGSNWYVPIPESLLRTRFYWDNSLPQVFNDTAINLNSSNYWYARNGSQLRFYYNQTARTFGINSKYVIFQFNSYVINNATTNGFTSNNVSLNGSRWTGDGSLAINLRNDSQLNMSGLVGYWSMDETQGTIIHNINTESGLINATNQGTWNGNTTLNSTIGIIGNAGSFDGVDDYVNAGNGESLNITSAITIEAWVKLLNLTDLHTIYSDGANGYLSTRRIDYEFESTSLNFAFSRDGFEYIKTTSSSSFNINTWYHVVVVYNGSNVLFYTNGIATGISASYPGTIYPKTRTSFIGTRRSNINYFNGSMDEFRIYNRALSASEIAVMYNTSLRSQAMPLILNQTASTGNVINRTRIVYTGQDSINNASIYARQNGTTAWSLVQANATSNTWYPITNQFNDMDFAVLIQGNGSNTPFFTSLEYDQNPVIAGTPTNLQNTTGNFFINHTWQGTATSYNVSVNGNWYNGTTSTFNYTVSSPHGWVNISVAGYLVIDGQTNLSSFVSMNTQIPNNPPVPKTTLHATYLVDTGTTLNFSVNSTDLDNDTLTYSSNNTIGIFNTTTGNFSYTGVDLDAGSYTFYFTVNDGNGGIVTQITTITEESITQLLLNALANLPTKADVSNAGATGFIGGILGGALVIGLLRKHRG